MPETRTVDADRQREIQALSAFLAAEPERWPELVPQMLDAVGAAQLRRIVETARRQVGRFEAVTDSPEGLVIIGQHSRALVWVLLDEQGELTNLLIGARGPRRLISRAGRARLVKMAFFLIAGGAGYLAWTATTAPVCVLAAIAPVTWLVLLEVGAPAAQPWWLRRTVQVCALVGLAALIRAPGLPFGDNPPLGGVFGLGLVVWWIVERLRARRHRWALATSAPLQLPVRGRWYVTDGGAPTRTLGREGKPDQQQTGAISLLQVGRWGTRRGPARRVESYFAYGQRAYSPCAGTVVAAVDGLIDQIPGWARFAPVDGNHVLIDTGAEVVKLAHLRAGSILVDPGDHVHAGQLLGEVGNSGRSNQPRLTIDAVRHGRKLDLMFTGIHGNLHAGRTIEA